MFGITGEYGETYNKLAERDRFDDLQIYVYKYDYCVFIFGYMIESRVYRTVRVS